MQETAGNDLISLDNCDLRFLTCYRSRWRDNGRLYAVPKFYRHTASVSCGQINPIDPLAGTSRWDLNPIDPLAGTSRWDLNPIDPLPGTTRGCVQHEW